MNIQILDRALFRYRLGDLVLLGNDAFRDILHPDCPFGESIGYEYASTTWKNKRFLDFELLKKLVANHADKHSYAVPNPDHLVVHYRAGDSKRVTDTQVQEMLSYISSACSEANLKAVTIVTAFHYGNGTSPDEIEALTNHNYDNLQSMLSSIRGIGLEASVKPTGEIDGDFCYLVKAKHFIPTHGGYSILAGVCNEAKVYASFPTTTASIVHYKNRGVAMLPKTSIFNSKRWFCKGYEYRRIERFLSQYRPANA